DDAGMASGLRTCVCGRADLQRCLCSMFGRLGSPDTDDQERVAQVMRKRSETGTRRVRTWTKVERPITSILHPGLLTRSRDAQDREFEGKGWIDRRYCAQAHADDQPRHKPAVGICIFPP